MAYTKVTRYRMLQWTIRRRLPKCDMAAYGSVSETGRVWVTNEGLASQRWLKVQSGHTVMGVDIPCLHAPGRVFRFTTRA